MLVCLFTCLLSATITPPLNLVCACMHVSECAICAACVLVLCIFIPDIVGVKSISIVSVPSKIFILVG